MLEIVDLSSLNNSNKKFGGKALGLALLNDNGFCIPSSIFVEATDNISDIDDKEFQCKLAEKLTPLEDNGCYNVAIRSSSLNEDAFVNSLAGHYKTIIGEMNFGELIDGMKEIILSLGWDSRDKMGIVIQEMIDADYSGVIFSSNPLNYSKGEMIISYTHGIGEGLVSGKVHGTDILVRITDSGLEFNDEPKFGFELSEVLCRSMKTLEQKCNYPIDVEWAIKDNCIIYLQCRPISSITGIASGVFPVAQESLRNIPKPLQSHDKVKLRLLAQNSGIAISNAYLFVQNECMGYRLSDGTIPKTENCTGYSAVVVYPKTISNKVIRSFVGDKKQINDSAMGCCRYGIRSFPKYKNIMECVHSFLQLAKDEYWVSAVILQEIYNPMYTGVIRKEQEIYLVEITKGHFLTKGVVPTSQYILRNKELVSKQEIEQERWYELIEGHVIECVCNEGADKRVSLSLNELRTVIDAFEQILSSDAVVVEFGILKGQSKDVIPYLIDFVDNSSGNEIKTADIESGIISKGKRSGIIRHISLESYDSLNIHYHDSIESEEKKADNIVFFCKRPDIGLLELLHSYDNSKISFVFAEASILCHFAVILRERKIPAVVIGEFQKFEYPNGKKCTVDADEENLVRQERILYEE